MIRQDDLSTTSSPGDAEASLSALRLTRGITATWWYTFGGVLFLESMAVVIWLAALLLLDSSDATMLVVLLGSLIWLASTVLLLLDYRGRRDDRRGQGWRRALALVLVAVAFGALAGVMSGLWVIAVLPVVQSLVLLNWPSGVRLRLTVTVTALLAVLAVVDAQLTLATPNAFDGFFLSVYAVIVPSSTVLSLWFWDVLVTLDRARLSEARLAATQERLRVATDVHDLQGHHLQVIALQLELAERLFERDPAASVEQLRAARASVDDARQGTRDLALRFRSASLRDELSNAVDLLRAAGTDAAVEVDGDCDAAPADVLGPVVRETTTNVLRHGGGEWARLSLTRDGGSWRYRIANDAGEHPDADDGGGAGLEGLQRRARDAGGTLEVHRDAGEFSVTMTVPAVPS